MNITALCGYIFGIGLAMYFGFLLGAEHPSKTAIKGTLINQEAVLKFWTEEVEKLKRLLRERDRYIKFLEYDFNKLKIVYTELTTILKEKAEKKTLPS